MRALVIYESMFGNTETVADAIAAGLAEYGPVDVRSVEEIDAVSVTKVDLLVLGGPTHAFSLSRPTTRRDAVAQGGRHGSVEMGLREWIDRLTAAFLPDRIAAFDTRVAKVHRLPGSAARKISSLLRTRGWPVMARNSFFVLDTRGPLQAGELERATAWGRRLGELAAVDEHVPPAAGLDASGGSWRPII